MGFILIEKNVKSRQLYHLKQQANRWVSVSDLQFKNVIPSSRDEHIDWLRSGTWAKDSWGGTEGLSEVKRLGQRYPDFGSYKGDK